MEQTHAFLTSKKLNNSGDNYMQQSFGGTPSLSRSSFNLLMLGNSMNQNKGLSKLGYVCAKSLQSCPTLCNPMDC